MHSRRETAKLSPELYSLTLSKRMTHLDPLHDNVIIEPIKSENTTASGIIIPETASKEKPQRGKVIAVAKDIKDVSVGDIVLFSKYAGTEVKIDGKELSILEFKSVLAIEK